MDKLVYNAETNETSVEQLSEEDLRLVAMIQEQKAIDAANAPVVVEDPNKVSAVAKLKALGLTEEEARAIAGL